MSLSPPSFSVPPTLLFIGPRQQTSKHAAVSRFPSEIYEQNLFGDDDTKTAESTRKRPQLTRNDYFWRLQHQAYTLPPPQPHHQAEPYL